MSTKLKEGMVINSPDLPEGNWLIIDVWEQEPRMTIGNRTSSYENQFKIIKLEEDGSYNEDNEQLTISTCYVYRNSINEDNIDFVKQMKKTYM